MNWAFDLWSWVVSIASAEWPLTKLKRANGGDVIAFRALWVATGLYTISLLAKFGIDHNGFHCLDMSHLVGEMRNTLPWLGAAFGAAYAAFYARFASQWHYLASLYNEIKQTEARAAKDADETTREKLAEWKAGFIEDAEDLHLATKPMFSSVIRVWGGDSLVQQKFESNTLGGRDRLDELIDRAKKVCERREVGRA